MSLGEALLAKGLKQTGGSGLLQLALSTALNRDVVIGTLMMACYFGLYMWALRLAPFSFVLPITALSYPLGGIFAKSLLHEEVGGLKWTGYIVILAGVVLTSIGEATGH